MCYQGKLETSYHALTGLLGSGDVTVYVLKSGAGDQESKENTNKDLFKNHVTLD